MDPLAKLKFKTFLGKNKNNESNNSNLDNMKLKTEESLPSSNNIVNFDKEIRKTVGENNILNLNLENEDYSQETKEFLSSKRKSVLNNARPKLENNLKSILNKEYLKQEGSDSHMKNALINYELNIENQNQAYKEKKNAQLGVSGISVGQIINNNDNHKESISKVEANNKIDEVIAQGLTNNEINKEKESIFNIKVKKEDDNDFLERPYNNSNKPKPKGNPFVRSATEKIIRHNPEFIEPRKSFEGELYNEGRISVKDLIKMNETKIRNSATERPSSNYNPIPLEIRNSVNENFNKNISEIKNYLTNMKSDSSIKTTEELKKLGVVDENGIKLRKLKFRIKYSQRDGSLL